MNKVYLVMCEDSNDYPNVYTSVDSIFSTKEFAENYRDYIDLKSPGFERYFVEEWEVEEW